MLTLIINYQKSGIWGDFPTLFKKCCGFFKVPRIGLVEVGRLGQRLNVPTQGRRVAQTGDERPFSLTAPGSHTQLEIEPRRLMHYHSATRTPNRF